LRLGDPRQEHLPVIVVGFAPRLLQAREPDRSDEEGRQATMTMTTCARCGKPAPQAAQRNKPFCSNTCRWGRVGKRSKLTVADILAIRADKRKARFIACDYGLSRGHISRIKTGEKWGHVNETNMRTPNGAARRHGAGLA
jgi:hypothetical protein